MFLLYGNRQKIASSFINMARTHSFSGRLCKYQMKSTIKEDSSFVHVFLLAYQKNPKQTHKKPQQKKKAQTTTNKKKHTKQNKKPTAQTYS